MPESQRFMVQLVPETQGTHRWRVPLSNPRKFRVINVVDGAGHETPFTLHGDQIIECSADLESSPLAEIELENPNGDIEAEKLQLEKEKARSEDRWRSRTYLFSIGSSILTAVVTLGVAMIARPSPSKSTLNLNSVRVCRDSLRRLPTLARLQNQTVQELSTAINRNVQDCDEILEELLTEAARRETK